MAGRRIRCTARWGRWRRHQGGEKSRLVPWPQRFHTLPPPRGSLSCLGWMHLCMAGPRPVVETVVASYHAGGSRLHWLRLWCDNTAECAHLCMPRHMKESLPALTPRYFISTRTWPSWSSGTGLEMTCRTSPGLPVCLATSCCLIFGIDVGVSACSAPASYDVSPEQDSDVACLVCVGVHHRGPGCWAGRVQRTRFPWKCNTASYRSPAGLPSWQSFQHEHEKKPDLLDACGLIVLAL